VWQVVTCVWPGVTLTEHWSPPVSGVGNVKTKAAGRGTVELISSCNGRKYILQLEDVLYIPMNRNNLIALGKWDKAGGHYIGGGGALTLITKDGTSVAWGTKVENNLYKMKVAIHKPNITIPKAMVATPQCFVANEPAQSWKTWHKRFGHISYSRLQHMLDKNLVEGFSVDMRMPKSDCIACTEAKQSVEPFGPHSDWKTEPRDLTHIDLWGKYDIASMNGNHHYIVLVDDSERYITTEFMNNKSNAIQKVKDYLVYLISHDMKPKAIHIDWGKEFVNKNLMAWCRERGIEIQMTAPYSPSQNGVAEHMNCTLVELARAMIWGIPEFLWEYMVSHASYLRNWTYTKSLKNKTPYEKQFKMKPNVSHLCEFGTSVWVLLQGQKEPRKMETKLRWRIFMGYDDGSKSIKYYNAETCKILTSQNFCFLSLTHDQSLPEPIEVTPDVPYEGESEGSILPTLGNNGDRPKQKRDKDEEPQNQRRTWGIRVDYRYLHNPFPDEDDNAYGLAFSSDDQLYAIIASDEYTSLKDARNSPDWPEWDKVIQSELAQLHQMGTWRLVEKLPKAIPIANKWTFLKKRNKAGEVIKFKARLVAKGCCKGSVLYGLLNFTSTQSLTNLVLLSVRL
jgi:hypothetical protein